MDLGPGGRPPPRPRRIRLLVLRRWLVVLLVFAFCMTAAGLLTAAWFTSGPATVVVGGIVVLGLARTAVFAMGRWSSRRVRTAQRTSGRRAERAMVPANPPIEQIAADLRRMLRTHDRVVRTRYLATTGRRVQALESAISTSALQAARALEVAHPTPAPYSGLETHQLRRLLQALTAEGLALPADVGLIRPDSSC